MKILATATPTFSNAWWKVSHWLDIFSFQANFQDTGSQPFQRVADHEIASTAWDETLQQVSKGWLTGPDTESQLDDRHSGVWIPSKRGAKIRAVDDCSEFHLEGIDQFAAFARFWASEALRVQIQRAGHSAAGNLKGRCMDLKAAYKQLARNPNHGWAFWRIERCDFLQSGSACLEGQRVPLGAS